MLEELGLLSRASQALHAGDAAKARRALEEHERRFRAGALKQERQGLSVLIDCGAESSSQARDAATRFLAASPHSPLAEAIRRRCEL
jgi:hypothetical protein